MTSSRHLAGLIGPAVMALTASEALNFRIWATNIAPVTYLNGTLLFVAGLSVLFAMGGFLTFKAYGRGES